MKDKYGKPMKTKARAKPMKGGRVTSHKKSKAKKK